MTTAARDPQIVPINPRLDRLAQRPSACHQSSP